MTAWNLRPIASALWRNRTGAILVAFQIAIGLAVLVNAVYVVKQRVEKIGRPSGMDTANMIWVASAGFAKEYDYDASWREDIATLRGLPGVKAASLFSNIPLSGGGSSNGFQASQVRSPPRNRCWATTTTSTAGVAALGVKLIAGRLFRHRNLPRLQKPSRCRRRQSSLDLPKCSRRIRPLGKPL
jgi:putative ABC transport system permease protein